MMQKTKFIEETCLDEIDKDILDLMYKSAILVSLCLQAVYLMGDGYG